MRAAEPLNVVPAAAPPVLVNVTALATEPALPVVFWFNVGNVQLVSVPLEGVPSAPLKVTNAPALPTLMPRAVTTPVPVVVVAGAAPAPPPMTMAFAARAADVAQVDALEK